VPVLIGTNLNEESYFVCATYANLSATGYYQLVNTSYPQNATELLQVGEEIGKGEHKWSEQHEMGGKRDKKRESENLFIYF
jgi:hypothetical protein